MHPSPLFLLRMPALKVLGHTHSHTHSLSLSLTHTLTHTHTLACRFPRLARWMARHMALAGQEPLVAWLMGCREEGECARLRASNARLYDRCVGFVLASRISMRACVYVCVCVRDL